LVNWFFAIAVSSFRTQSMSDKKANVNPATPSARLPAKPPKSAGQFEKAVRAYARARGLAEGRVRDWISYMALGGRLEAAAQASGTGRLFSLKGGIVMEMRRRDVGAGATQDLDLIYLGSDADVVPVIEDANAEPYGRFTMAASPSVARGRRMT
jgi:hypothetical protein